MEPEGSLPQSQVPATCSYPEPTSNWFRIVLAPHPTSWRYILLLSSHLRLGLPSDPFPQVSPPTPCTRLSSPPYALHAPFNSFFSILSPEHYWVRCTDYSAPHYVVFSTPLLPLLSPLGPNILLNTLFSNTLSLRSSLSVGDQVSYPYKTTGKI